MKRIVTGVIMLFLALFSLYAQQERASVSGRVTDAVTGESLQGAHIYLRQHRQGLSSDDAGRFKLLLPKGKAFEVTVSFVGYTTQRLHLCLQNDTTMTVRMRQDNRLADVNIYGTRHDFGVQHSQMSAIEMPIAKIENVPALFGEVDVLKALQRLPGVQSANDGQAGIYVRGGNYDQNQITMDGATLYNAEHLKGFVSAINPDVVESVVFYKGAFPARYGGQLSSVVDIGMREGDMKQYHGEVSLGMLSSKIHAEGPIWKDKTSFNVAARASYFNWIVLPMLKWVANQKSIMVSYADINYYDVSAKLSHRFNDKHKLSAFFYYGKDINSQMPAGEEQTVTSQSDETIIEITENNRKTGTKNNWHNIASSLNWVNRLNQHLLMHVNLNYSQYNYSLNQVSERYSKKTVIGENGTKKLLKRQTANSGVEYLSGIQELAATATFNYHPSEKHNLRWGAKLSQQWFNPKVKIHQYNLNQDSTSLSENQIDTIVGGQNNSLMTAALFVEDDWVLGKHWKANIGLRTVMFHVPNKNYISIEPRISLRWLFRKDMALKVSYTRMSQGMHLLSNSNLVSPSDLWVPITHDIPLMKSDQFALGYNFESSKGIGVSVEGYYKRMDNLLEYLEGTSFMNVYEGWRNMVCMGKGEAYGVELYAEKNTGRTTGWVSYTWSKSLRLFDRPGEELNGGRVYYSGNDRRHNFNIVLAHKFNKHWDVSAAWTYQSGRRGTLQVMTYMGGVSYDYGSYYKLKPGNEYTWDFGVTTMYDRFSSPTAGTNIVSYMPVSSYRERNSYVLPAVHRLDAGVNYRTTNRWFGRTVEQVLNLSFYNLYNRMNISNIYWGYDNNKLVLKGICMFPFMPSVSYSIKF